MSGSGRTSSAKTHRRRRQGSDKGNEQPNPRTQAKVPPGEPVEPQPPERRGDEQRDS